MKRLLQFVAMAVIGIVTAQPVLAGFTCTMGMGSGASHCGMAMHKGMACHRAPQSAGLQGMPASCRNCSLQDAAQFSPGAKPKAGSNALPVAFEPLPTVAPAAASRSTGPPPLSCPDRCVLYQVFRI